MTAEKYLLPEDDGLPTRSSQSYARYKLNAIATYLTIANTAMRAGNWIERYYIDLQAGPGKNKIGNSILLGSPLIALTVPHPTTEFRFNELDTALNSALQQRVSASSLRDRIKIYRKDVNQVADEICKEIVVQDKKAASLGKWSTFNIAFLDPLGLELHWSTVESLARMKKMDLIITFSTSGIVRAIGAGEFDAVNRFFGTDGWREIDKPSMIPATRRRNLIDFYRKRLEQFGYHIDIDPNLGEMI